MNGPLTRRELLELTAAAVAATPLVKASAEALVTASPPGKYLTAAELALLDELSEMIIPTDDHSPGAKAAGVAAYIDYRLSISVEPDWKLKWRNGLKLVNRLSHSLNNTTIHDGSAYKRLDVRRTVA